MDDAALKSEVRSVPERNKSLPLEVCFIRISIVYCAVEVVDVSSVTSSSPGLRSSAPSSDGPSDVVCTRLPLVPPSLSSPPLLLLGRGLDESRRFSLYDSRFFSHHRFLQNLMYVTVCVSFFVLGVFA